MFVFCHVLQLQTHTTVKQPHLGKEKQAARKKSVPKKKTVPSKKVGEPSGNNSQPSLAANIVNTQPPSGNNSQPPPTVTTGPPAGSNYTPGANNTVNVTKTFIVTKTMNVTKTVNVTSSVPIAATKAKPQVVGQNVLMVPKKGRTTCTKRKSGELEPLGTQQSVNKK